MSDKIVVPTLGESVTEATVSKWLKSQGENVSADEPIVELETDKVNVEVPAPSSGVLESISVKEGETVNVGSLLGMINESSKKNVEPLKEQKSYSPPKRNNKILTESQSETPKIFENAKEKIIPQIEEPLILENEHKEKTQKNKTIAISPAARKMIEEAKIDINQIHGSGKNGVILKEDVMSLMGARPSPSERKIKHGPEERIKMTRLRITIAKRLKEAQENAAMLTTFNEVDMSEVISMRNEYKDEFQKNTQ